MVLPKGIVLKSIKPVSFTPVSKVTLNPPLSIADKVVTSVSCSVGAVPVAVNAPPWI